MEENSLAHYGVLGMKWGVRRYRNKDGSLTNAGKKRYSEEYTTKTKNNESLTLKRNKGGILSKSLQKISPSIREEADKTYNYDAYVNGKKVGNYQMYRKSKDEMNITWGSTDKKYRGRGYMQAMEKLGEQIAKKYGATKMTAELVGNSPDIHTVARKAGYKVTGEIRTKDVLETWGGLTLVEKDLK